MQSDYPHIGTLTKADSFVTAASYIDEASRARKPSTVTYFHVDIKVYDVFCYLCAHAIELALKSILTLNGYEDSRLRRIGHDLQETWNHVKRCDFPRSKVVLNEKLRLIVEWLNPYYKNKELEYFMGPSYGSFPHSDPLLEITTSLISELDTVYRALLIESRSKSNS